MNGKVWNGVNSEKSYLRYLNIQSESVKHKVPEQERLAQDNRLKNKQQLAKNWLLFLLLMGRIVQDHIGKISEHIVGILM